MTERKGRESRAPAVSKANRRRRVSRDRFPLRAKRAWRDGFRAAREGRERVVPYSNRYTGWLQQAWLAGWNAGVPRHWTTKKAAQEARERREKASE